MKKITIFPLISCLLILCSYGISLADETSAQQQCINSCDEKLQICLNINTDRNMCEAEFQDCVKNCEPESDSSSPTQQDSNSEPPIPQ
jgi:hypothetical protein